MGTVGSNGLNSEELWNKADVLLFRACLRIGTGIFLQGTFKSSSFLLVNC